MNDSQKLPGFITGDPSRGFAEETHSLRAASDQLERERGARDAALGRRAQQVLKGDFGPVLRRWVSGTVVPVSGRMQRASVGWLGGDREAIIRELSSPVFGVPDPYSSTAMRALLGWFLKPGISDDMVLAVVGTAITRCGQAKSPVKLTALLGQCAEAARECGMGQFVTQVQGAKAMLQVRKGSKAAWKQHQKLDAVAALLGGQVRSGILQQDDMAALNETEVPLEHGRRVVSIITPKGDTRRIDLREPSPEDWAFLEIARVTSGETDPHRSLWITFAMMVLCAAQAEAGWFDLVKADKVGTINSRRKPTQLAHGLVLSDSAHAAIMKDLDRWMHMGFTSEPMLVKPEDGDYLSVKHREVAGGRGPMGIKTNAKGTAAHRAACSAMAETEWNVAVGTLEFLDTDLGKELLLRDYGGTQPDTVKTYDGTYLTGSYHREPTGKTVAIVAAYKRLAVKGFYLPIYMDFRGRIYYRPNQVTFQGSDLQKGLMCFPGGVSVGNRPWDPSRYQLQVIANHASNCFGGGVDKGSLEERLYWFQKAVSHWSVGSTKMLLEADEPFCLYTCMDLFTKGEWDRIPLQIDGTCNGLQHLAALFRDETAAPFVNLTGGHDRPADVYGEVGKRVMERLALLQGDRNAVWAHRLLAAIHVDRSLVKKAVMVLPYGGTRGTIDEAMLAGILEQGPKADYWLAGWRSTGVSGTNTIWGDWVEGNYAAYSERALKDHPLLHLDAKRLGGLVWDVICEVLPRTMIGMKAFRDIARKVGTRTLEWDTGFWDDKGDSLWVTQAKAKADRSSLRFMGLHLPGSVRGLTIRAGKDEVDSLAHTTGIVANKIHSQDASHMARTMAAFVKRGGTSFGGIHDCFATRASQMGILKEAVRGTFAAQYNLDPLAQAVQLYDLKGKTAEAFGSFYELATWAGVEFPADGTWKPEEVMDSEWCFS